LGGRISAVKVPFCVPYGEGLIKGKKVTSPRKGGRGKARGLGTRYEAVTKKSRIENSVRLAKLMKNTKDSVRISKVTVERKKKKVRK